MRKVLDYWVGYHKGKDKVCALILDDLPGGFVLYGYSGLRDKQLNPRLLGSFTFPALARIAMRKTISGYSLAGFADVDEDGVGCRVDKNTNGLKQILQSVVFKVGEDEDGNPVYVNLRDDLTAVCLNNVGMGGAFDEGVEYVVAGFSRSRDAISDAVLLVRVYDKSGDIQTCSLDRFRIVYDSQ